MIAKAHRMSALVAVLCALVVGCSAGCGGSQAPTTEPAPSNEPTTGNEPAPGDTVGQTEQPVEGEAAPEGDAPRGRMAFTQCTDPRAEMCTKEYRPVCGVVDTGVRCITTPCDSTEQRNFGNACMACAEAKTTGYWPVACEELGSDAR